MPSVAAPTENEAVRPTFEIVICRRQRATEHRPEAERFEHAAAGGHAINELPFSPPCSVEPAPEPREGTFHNLTIANLGMDRLRPGRPTFVRGSDDHQSFGIGNRERAAECRVEQGENVPIPLGALARRRLAAGA